MVAEIYPDCEVVEHLTVTRSDDPRADLTPLMFVGRFNNVYAVANVYYLDYKMIDTKSKPEVLVEYDKCGAEYPVSPFHQRST